MLYYIYTYINMCSRMPRCVLKSNTPFYIHVYRLSEKMYTRVCAILYFIDIFLYIISYVNVHFCCSY